MEEIRLTSWYGKYPIIYIQVFIHSRWCRISSINSITSVFQIWAIFSCIPNILGKNTLPNILDTGLEMHSEGGKLPPKTDLNVLRVFGLSKQTAIWNRYSPQLGIENIPIVNTAESLWILSTLGQTGDDIWQKHRGNLSSFWYSLWLAAKKNLESIIDHMAEASVFISVRMRWRSSWQRWKPFAPAAAVRVNWVATCRRFHGPMVFAITRIFRSWMVPFGCKMLGLIIVWGLQGLQWLSLIIVIRSIPPTVFNITVFDDQPVSVMSIRGHIWDTCNI